jgi:hypothetical protein
MRTAGILFLSAGLSACAATPPVSEATGVASFNKAELAAIDTQTCADELGRATHGERWWLCGYGWRPGQEPGSAKAVESYRLYWVRPDAQRLVLRIARYEDGSGVLWAAADEKTDKAPEMKVTTLKEAEFAPLFGRLQASPLWGSSYARPGAAAQGSCKAVARWILEGQRSDDHRAVSVQSCGAGRWVIDLGTDLVQFARSKIGDLPAGAIY